MKFIGSILIGTSLIILAGCREKDGVPRLTGPYLGLQLPGDIPEFFAPGIVTTRYHEHSAPAVSPDGNEIYWSAFLAPLQAQSPQVILYSRIENGEWTRPEVAPFSGRYTEGGPCFSSDGNRLYFGSCRPVNGQGEPKDWDIWVVEKTVSGWGNPKNLGSPVNSGKDEGQPTITKDGNLYFLGEHDGYLYQNCIYRSRFRNGLYEEPEPLGEPINVRGTYAWCPFIAPEEDYLLFASDRQAGFGMGDLYISFRRDDETWTEPANLGPAINSDDNDRFPAVSPDGRALFFTSKRKSFGSYYLTRQNLDALMGRYAHPGNGLDDVYWVDARIMERFKPKNLKKE